MTVVFFAMPAFASAAEPDISAATAAICKNVEGREPSVADRPPMMPAKTFANCNSEALYYGENGPPDYRQARLCAFEEDAWGLRPSKITELFEGKTILMQIYANGLGGARRDLDLATAYACQIGGSPGEIKERVEHLQALKAKPATKRFDYCDDKITDFTAGFCSGRDAKIARRARDIRLSKIEARLPAGAGAPLAALRKAAAFYADASSAEVDTTGTGRAWLQIGAQEELRDAYAKDFTELMSGRWPSASPAQAKAAEAALNRTYRTALAYMASKDNLSSVKPADSRKVQGAWIAYRDAFVAFARVAAPNIPPQAVAARLARERTEDLSGWRVLKPRR